MLMIVGGLWHNLTTINLKNSYRLRFYLSYTLLC
jgi:hypothetical protein